MSVAKGKPDLISGVSVSLCHEWHPVAAALDTCAGNL